MHTRTPASVLPEPVGAAMSVSFPAAICGHPWLCAGVGPSANRRSNQARTAGWNALMSLMWERQFYHCAQNRCSVRAGDSEVPIQQVAEESAAAAKEPATATQSAARALVTVVLFGSVL